MNAAPRESVSTAWYVRDVVRNQYAIGDEFTAQDVADRIAIGAKVTAGAASSALSDLAGYYKAVAVARRDGHRAVWQKIAEVPDIAPRKRRNVTPPPPPMVQQAMPLSPPSPEATLDMDALRRQVHGCAVLLGIAFDIKSVSDADFWAEAARRSAGRP